jgi:hypothetical protein
MEVQKIKSDRHKNERRGRIVSELPIAVNLSCFSREGRPQSPGWRIRRKNEAFPTARGTAVLPDEQEFKDERPVGDSAGNSGLSVFKIVLRERGIV